MGQFFYIILLILLFSVPYVFIYFGGNINRELNKLNTSIKAPDILTFYLIAGVIIFGPLAFGGVTAFLIFLLIVALVGVGVVSYYVFYQKDFDRLHTLKIWWRLVFLVSLVFYTILGIIGIFRLIFF